MPPIPSPTQKLRSPLAHIIPTSTYVLNYTTSSQMLTDSRCVYQMSRDRPVERCIECGNVLKMEYVGPPDDPHAHRKSPLLCSPTLFFNTTTIQYYNYVEKDDADMIWNQNRRRRPPQLRGTKDVCGFRKAGVSIGYGGKGGAKENVGEEGGGGLCIFYH